jgi:alkanesulfonate monooxygenase SsuD/methylene tetrahydromethanopterin reductase-like flavin-dependent oxidoreductase (luciferase family)
MAIKISVELSHICPLEDITKHAAALESNGYFRVWVPDTVVSPWEAWLAASIIMQHTNRLEIGLGVTNPYTRHPVVVAQMAATMQHLSSGRLTMSIGKGIGRFLEKAGIEQHASAVEECITVLRKLIAGERTSFDGKAFHIDGMRIRTLVPDEAVPIYLAAIGTASWEAAMRVADGVATIWGDTTAQTRRQVMTERTLPTAALIPFSLNREDFFEHRLSSLEDLQEGIEKLEKEGLDEVIIAYADMVDLETAAQVIKDHE